MAVLRCKDLFTHIGDYVDGEIAPALKADIDQHLSGCQLCRAVVESYKKTINLLRKASTMEPDQEMVKRVQKYLSSRLTK